MTVKDFILQHPGSVLNMMTPGGYVYLTPENAQALLNGQSTKGHPGDPEMAMEIGAEELLSQVVADTFKYRNDAWCFMTDCPQHSQESTESTVPDRNEILIQLRTKLDRNLAAMQQEWYALPPSLLAGKAQEIEATRIVYDELHSGWAYNEQALEYLLRFENPLEVVRDKWIEEQCLPDVSAEMSHVLGSLADEQEAELNYALDEGYTQEQAGGMKLC